MNDKYQSVSEEDSRIGDVITYKLTESSRESVANDYIMKNERHFSIILLKDKEGKKPSKILQKNGAIPLDFKVDDANDNSLPTSEGKINYEPTTPSSQTGTSGSAASPINRRVNEE